MKFAIFVFVALFAVAFARPGGHDAEILKLDSDVQPEHYNYAYETSDGTKHDEAGQLKDVGTEHEAIVVHGSYSWVDDEGHSHTVNYVADENGYQPTSDDIPHA